MDAASQIPDFTTVIAVDAEHLEELKLVWPTWRAFKPEIMQRPMLIIGDQLPGTAPLYFVDHPQAKFIHCYANNSWPQRERMLSSFVLEAPAFIHTPYYLKLDTDCLATGPGEWILPWWFDGDPAFIASPWGYSKPADVLLRLDEWGNRTPGINDRPPLNIPFDPAAKSIRHRRMISYCMFGNTDWTREAARLSGSRLPVPSQDTYLWYVAARRNDFFRIIQMKNYGWHHCRREKLKAACESVLRNHGLQAAG